MQLCYFCRCHHLYFSSTTISFMRPIFTVLLPVGSVSHRLPEPYKSKVGIPYVHWYHGMEGDYNVMILNLLGPSLEAVISASNSKQSLCWPTTSLAALNTPSPNLSSTAVSNLAISSLALSKKQSEGRSNE